MPNLNETDQVLLESCMDEIRNVVGDSVSEKQLVETIMKHKFDCTKALDAILNNSTETPVTSSTLAQGTAPMETGNYYIYHYTIVTSLIRQQQHLFIQLVFTLIQKFFVILSSFFIFSCLINFIRSHSSQR